MPHMSLMFYILKNISKMTKKIIFIAVFVLLVIVGSTYGRNLHLTYIEQIWFALLVLYFIFPIIILGTDALSPDDD